MEDIQPIQNEARRGVSFRIKELEDQIEYLKKKDPNLKQSQYKLPWKWKKNYNKQFKKGNENKQLCLYITKKNELQGPMLLPIIGGNIIIHNNKAHEFIPSRTLLHRNGTKIESIYVIREIDRKPVCNADWNAVKARGDSTRNDEILLKMLKLAMVEKVKKEISKSIWWILGIGIAAVIVGYMVFG